MPAQLKFPEPEGACAHLFCFSAWQVSLSPLRSIPDVWTDRLNRLSFGLYHQVSNYMKRLIHLRQVITDLIAAGWLNKYTVSAGLFVMWMLFFDKHNFFTQWNLRRSVHQLESSIEDYREQLANAEAAHKDLMNNKEKFAREKYLMHRPDEDVFLFQ